jgi:hypothetical protein
MASRSEARLPQRRVGRGDEGHRPVPRRPACRAARRPPEDVALHRGRRAIPGLLPEARRPVQLNWQSAARPNKKKASRGKDKFTCPSACRNLYGADSAVTSAPLRRPDGTGDSMTLVQAPWPARRHLVWSVSLPHQPPPGVLLREGADAADRPSAAEWPSSWSRSCSTTPSTRERPASPRW